MSNTALWTAVKASYDSAGLISLTNLGDNDASSTINDTVGELAAQNVIDLWPAYAQTAYDAAEALHVEVAKQGVIALLFRRGGTALEVEKIRWEEVFGDEGLIAAVRKTGPRSHRVGATNSDVQAARLLSGNRKYLGWGDREAYPRGVLPRRQPWSHSNDYNAW